MKSIILSSFIIVINLGICNAQTTTGSTAPANKLNTRVETVTQHLTQQLNLSPSQQEQVKVVYQNSLQQIQQVVEANNGDKSVAAEQMHTLIAQRNIALQNILTPSQLTIYNSNTKK